MGNYPAPQPGDPEGEVQGQAAQRSRMAYLQHQPAQGGCRKPEDRGSLLDGKPAQRTCGGPAGILSTCCRVETGRRGDASNRGVLSYRPKGTLRAASRLWQ